LIGDEQINNQTGHIAQKVKSIMKCSICENEIDVVKHPITNKVLWDEGHNAQPAKSGRCCTRCNDDVVIPMRLKKMRTKSNNTEIGEVCFICPNCGPGIPVLSELWIKDTDGPHTIDVIHHEDAVAVLVTSIELHTKVKGVQEIFNFCARCSELIRPPIPTKVILATEEIDKQGFTNKEVRSKS
jgi:hypothetical protein